MESQTTTKPYFDFHSKDTTLAKNEMVSLSDYCEQEGSSFAPFLSFPITKRCNFKCTYCGVGGEATSSNSELISLDRVMALSRMGIEHGITKFRVTGGEPFTHKDIGGILGYFSDLGYYTLVNTNGSLIVRHSDIIERLNRTIRFAVSLDTLEQEKLAWISKFNKLDVILQGLELLADKGLLLRCNMVVGRHNIEEVPAIIQLCQRLNCDLKLLDIVSVPVPYGNRTNLYQEVNNLEKQMLESCDEVFSHEYTRRFGTPCYRYRFGNTFVTVKNSQKGSHYDRTEGGLCENCKYYPCHEGLYDIFALADGRLCSCRWTEKQFSSDSSVQMDYLIKAFRRSRYHPKPGNNNMEIRTDLI